MKTLQHYEDELTTSIQSITLLGQLGYDKTDLGHLRAALRPLFSGSAARGLRTVGERYHRAFALYLVLEGVYQYKAGTYWAGLDEALGLGSNDRKEAGALFRVTLRAEGLPTFEDLPGHAHITPILAHGGIPTYCLDDTFDLLDRVTRRDTQVDVATLMEEWAHGNPAHSSHPLSKLDRPARRFLLHGRDVAEEFVERCLALWRDDDDPHTLDLPRRVLAAYGQWREAHPRAQQQHRARLGRPRLTYDPYGEGVAIRLPPVVYSAGSAPGALVWRVEAGGRHRDEPTRRRELGGETEFATREVVNVLTVAAGYTVTALADGETLQQWTLPGPDAPPLLAFDTATDELLPRGRADGEGDYWLSPGERRLIFPRDWTATPTQARKLVELPPPDGEWARFAAETWLLEPDGCLELTAPDGARATFRARNDPPPARPQFDGAPLLAAGPNERFTLYAGAPPLLCIPPGRSEHKPDKWRIEIIPVGAADPPTPRACSLAALPGHCVMVDGDVVLSLDAPELLGPAPFGEFHIRLRGPYGRKAAFDVGFAPGLRFHDYPHLELAAGDAPTRFGIAHATGFELLPGDAAITLTPAPAAPGEAAHVLVSHDIVAYDLSAAPELPRLPLVLRGPRGEMPFDLPVYRLRFGLVEPERPDDFRWTTTPLRIHPKALDASHTALLRADLPLPPGEGERLAGWRLVDADGRVRQEQPPRPTTRHPQTGLAQWLDTFRDGGGAAVLQLVTSGGPQPGETVVDVARLLPTLELGHVVTAWPPHGRLTVLWNGATTARNRQLRLWPIDRPWVAAPVALPVADDADGAAEWDVAADQLPPGDYLAEMVVYDPWAGGPPTRPAPGGANVFTLRPDDPRAALDLALSRARRDELPPDEALGWLLFLARTRLDTAVARLNVTLWRARASLSADQSLLWADAVGALGDPTAYQIVQKALFDGGFLDRLARLSAEQRTAYLGHLPDTLDADIYRALLPFVAGEPRRVCLRVLCRAGDEAAFGALVGDAPHGDAPADDDARARWRESAVALLLLSPREAADFLFDAVADPAAAELFRALLLAAPDDRFIVKGSLLETNAGQVEVTGIRRADQALVDFCRADDPGHNILGRLWPSTSKLSVQIDLAVPNIRVYGPLYRCAFTGQPQCDHVYRHPEELRRHHQQKHRMMERLPDSRKILILPLTRLIALPPSET